MSFSRLGVLALLLPFCLLALGCHSPSTEVSTPESSAPEVENPGVEGLEIETSAVEAPGPAVHLSHVPDDLNLSTERASRDGRFLGRLVSERQPPPLDSLHTWILKLEDPAGSPVIEARVRVDGGMPQHSHGLPTQPLARPGEEEGTYLLEGVRFHMRGWWQLILVIDDSAAGDAVAGDTEGSDLLTFDFVLE